MGKDLGTYFLRVEFKDGMGYIQTWNTSWRYMNGCYEEGPLEVKWIDPTYDSEEELFTNMKFMYLDGSYSCDCNRSLFLARAYQKEDPQNPPCGDKISLKRLTAIRPNREEMVIWEDGSISN